MSRMDQADALLRQVFGFTGFNPGQAEAVTRLLDGKNVLAVFPTGAGKSLCYQLTALALPGVTVVISPLIALMKDQIDFLKSKGVAAERFDSSLTAERAREVRELFATGRLKILYISPERLANERFLRLMARVKVSLLAVDEAHCISQWGHNFRPEYLKIAKTAKELGIPRVLALTATADRETAADIARAFAIEPGDIVHTGFYRPNLTLYATPAEPGRRKKLLLERLTGLPPGPAVVYVTLQATAESLAAYLAENGVAALAYHAGMAAEDRERVQEAFMASDHLVIVATIAFGMGVDKSDIRSVYHYNLPKGVESYAQEIGRAGRDGLPSRCEMFASARDTLVLENFVLGDTPEPADIASMLRELFTGEDALLISPPALAARHDIRDLVTRTLLTYLELDGYLLALGHIYTNYILTPNKPSAEMLAPFDAERQAFLRRVLSKVKPKRNGSFAIDAQEVAEAINEPRERIVAALEYLDGKGDIDLAASGTRQRYQVLRRPDDILALAAKAFERFEERERRDIARVRQLLGLAKEPGCLTRRLLAHFGEDRGPCGHCGPCLGEPPCIPAPYAPRKPRGRSLVKLDALVAEQNPGLATPRKLAKFLCGLTSPATSRMKDHPAFGLFERLPFASVLDLAGQALDHPVAGEETTE